MSNSASAIVDELMGTCLDGYIEKYAYKNGIRYIIKPSNLFIELHVISEGNSICVEIWNNKYSASPIFAQSFTGDVPEDLLNYIICRIYKLLTVEVMMSSRPSQEAPLKASEVK